MNTCMKQKDKFLFKQDFKKLSGLQNRFTGRTLRFSFTQFKYLREKKTMKTVHPLVCPFDPSSTPNFEARKNKHTVKHPLVCSIIVWPSNENE